MAGGIATRYSLAERESMAAWDESCMEKPLTAEEWRLSEELDRLALGKIPEIWKRVPKPPKSEKQLQTQREASRRWREAHKDYDRRYKAEHREKRIAQERARYRAAAAAMAVLEAAESA